MNFTEKNKSIGFFGGGEEKTNFIFYFLYNRNEKGNFKGTFIRYSIFHSLYLLLLLKSVIICSDYKKDPDINNYSINYFLLDFFPLKQIFTVDKF